MDFNRVDRDIKIDYPGGMTHNIKAQYVQITKDGRYLLNYLELRKGVYVPSFTEIINIRGEWAKSPFHFKYEEYDFEEYNRELSDKIISELPQNMKIRIKLDDDRKESRLSEVININHGAKEIVVNSKNDIYYILFPNYEDDKINLESFYPFGLPFPAFTYIGKKNHNDVSYNDDLNSNLDYEEIQLSKYGLSLENRNKITEYLRNQNGIINIKELPSFEINNTWTNEKGRVHFVNCSNLDMFGALYKTRNIYVDCDGNEQQKTEELLSKAFDNEVAMFYETENGLKKNNGVRHNKNVNKL